MVGAEPGAKRASESFPEDLLDFNAFTSAFKTQKPIRSLKSLPNWLGLGSTYERRPVSTGTDAVLDPPAYGACGGVNGKPQQPRRAAPKVRGLRNMSMRAL